MAPPELARDAPVGRVLERVDREAVLALGVVADASRLKRVDRGSSELVHPAPPLQRDERLDPRMATLAGADGVSVALALLQLSVLLPPLHDAGVRSGLVEPGELRGGDQPPVEPDHGERLEVVVAADLEVGGVMAGRDLQRP